MGAIEKFLTYYQNDRSLYTLLSGAIQRGGYSLSHAQIRLILHMNSGSLQVTDIARSLQIAPQSAGQLIKKCVQSGLIEAGKGDPDDARIRSHLLSEEGLKVLALLREALETETVQAILK